MKGEDGVRNETIYKRADSVGNPAIYILSDAIICRTDRHDGTCVFDYSSDIYSLSNVGNRFR